MPALYEENGRNGALAQLLLHELQLAPALLAPLPRDLRLASRIIRSLPEDRARQLHRSQRTLMARKGPRREPHR